MPAVSHVPEDSPNSSDGKELEEHPCLRWTGSNRMMPILVFYADGIVTKDSNLRLIGERYHLAYKIIRTESRLVRSILTVHGFHEVHPNSNDFNLMWTGSHLKPYLLRTLLEFQKVNHFPRSYELTRKDRLYKNIQRMQQTHGFKHFNIIPQAFILPSEYQELWNAHSKDKGPWIVKPVASSRGRGVYLVSSPSQITTDESILVSRYIRSPLLIDDFKFDIRLYVLVTSYDPLVVYLYEEGLTRFATVKYDRGTRNIKNQFMHLTNYSINKKSRDYVSCDDPEVEDYGNKWSMSAMLRYLKQEEVDTTSLMTQIEDLIIKALMSAELPIASATKMFVPHKGNCFELYGFDVLIDSNLKPWLLEVNLSPSLACDAPLDLKIKASLLTDMFTLVGIVCHDPIVRQGRQGKAVCDFPPRPQSQKPRQLLPMSANNTEVKNRLPSGKEKAWDVQGPSTLRLTMEEIRVVRRTMEENERKGGFIRIFPTAESWEFYGQFLEHKTTLNYVLAVHLFTGKQGARRPASLARARNGVTQNSQTPCRQEALHVKHLQPDERKLLSLEARRQKQHQVTLPMSRGKGTVPLASSCASDCEEEGKEEAANEEEVSECEAEVSSFVCNPQDLGKAPASQRSNDEGQQKAPKHEIGDKQALSSNQAWTRPKEGENKEQPRANLLQKLKQGGNLSKVQARLAFAAYLQQVQLRLLKECCGQSKIGAWAEQEEEQMELVIRFLKRASRNFQQTMPVALPSSRLPASERKRLLAQQLGVFIRCYSKETDEIIKRNQMDLNVESCIQQKEFQVFVNEASEPEMEELLTIYTRKNKSASVFLGTRTRNRNWSTSTEEASGKSSTASCGIAVKPTVNTPHLSNQGLAVSKEGDSSASDSSSDGSLLMQTSSIHCIYPPRTPLQSLGRLPLSRPWDTCTVPPPESIPLEAGSGSRTGSVACRVGSAIPLSHHPHSLGKPQRPSSNNLFLSPSSSIQAAAQIYSQKLSRPSSTTAGLGARWSQRQRPGTAGVEGRGNHPSILLEDLNHDAVSIMLERLAAKQTPRQYSSSTHINLLTQHLSNAKLANGAVSRGSVSVPPSGQSSISNFGLERPAHPDLQAPQSGCVNKTASDASCSLTEHKADGACPSMTVQQKPPYSLQQHQHPPQSLDTGRTRRQAISAENHLLTSDPSSHWAAPPTVGNQKPQTSIPWPARQHVLEARPGSPPLLPRPPVNNKQGACRQAGTQRVARSDHRPSRELESEGSRSQQTRPPLTRPHRPISTDPSPQTHPH
ncbi:tubulin polyglutamylase TTLL5 isoform X2 [Narcine bancroftii]|uniref:tubulin polyglutamylase TTLL5 isoform X2 n=1 Tax=Narcine bancroftii TaxID=1343680 RepID=UPI0038315858